MREVTIANHPAQKIGARGHFDQIVQVQHTRGHVSNYRFWVDLGDHTLIGERP